MQRRSIRFANAALQQCFVDELRRNAVPFTLSAVGAVECSESEWAGVNSVAHTIRDGCFAWYFSWLDTPDDAARFAQALRAAALQFEVECHDGRDVFLLPRADRSTHRRLFVESFCSSQDESHEH